MKQAALFETQHVNPFWGILDETAEALRHGRWGFEGKPPA
jgi:hypothetical protein